MLDEPLFEQRIGPREVDSVVDVVAHLPRRYSEEYGFGGASSVMLWFRTPLDIIANHGT